MRKISFRAWHKDGGMGKPFILDDLTNTIAQPKYPLKDYVIMQFTGLKDKTGRDIYEDDIIAQDGNKLGRVRFWMGWFCYYGRDARRQHKHYCNPTGLYMFYMPDGSGCSIEVIGNIHENPEMPEYGWQEGEENPELPKPEQRGKEHPFYTKKGNRSK